MKDKCRFLSQFFYIRFNIQTPTSIYRKSHQENIGELKPCGRPIRLIKRLNHFLNQNPHRRPHSLALIKGFLSAPEKVIKAILTVYIVKFSLHMFFGLKDPFTGLRIYFIFQAPPLLRYSYQMLLPLFFKKQLRFPRQEYGPYESRHGELLQRQISITQSRILVVQRQIAITQRQIVIAQRQMQRTHTETGVKQKSHCRQALPVLYPKIAKFHCFFVFTYGNASQKGNE